MNGTEQSGSGRHLITDAQVHLQVPRAVAPYVGVGAGVMSFIGGATSSTHDFTTSAAAGVRLWQVLPRAVVRAEMRARGIGADFSERILEWTGGVGWAF